MKSPTTPRMAVSSQPADNGGVGYTTGVAVGAFRTRATNVRLASPAFPVTSQQPTVGKRIAVDWKPVSPYPSGMFAASGGAGASSRRPAMVSVPRTPGPRHQGTSSPAHHSASPSRRG